jgi:hypothetical protein
MLDGVKFPIGGIMYVVVSAGVNQTPGGAALSFAEKDAKDMRDALVGAAGPVERHDAGLLLGATCTRQCLWDRLMDASLQNPTYFLFFFSGHGNEDGLAVADGLFEYKVLHRALKVVNAPFTLVVLDVCNAGAFMIKEGAVVYGATPDLSWMDALSSATPGTRLFFSTGASRTASESYTLKNGAFTAALLAGMRAGTPRIGEFVSDATAFNYARLHMRHMQKLTQVPESRGLTGDFPMLRSETMTWIGSAAIVDASVLPHALHVEVLVTDREHVPTTVRHRLLSCEGKVLKNESIRLSPDNGQAVFTFQVPFDPTPIRNDRRSQLRIILNSQTRFLQHIEILDGAGDVLDEHWVDCLYPA